MSIVNLRYKRVNITILWTSHLWSPKYFQISSFIFIGTMVIELQVIDFRKKKKKKKN